jgi:hypothetical protein
MAKETRTVYRLFLYTVPNGRTLSLNYFYSVIRNLSIDMEENITSY